MENLNFTKIHFLVDRSTILLRHLFKERWKAIYNSDWSSASSHLFINGLGKSIFEKNKKHKIQRENMLSGDVNRWDSTLLTDILLDNNFSCTLLPNPENDKMERDMLGNLKRIRNKLFHHGAFNLDDDLFHKLWEESAPILLFLGYPAQHLQKLKSAAILLDMNDGYSKSTINEENLAQYKKLSKAAQDLCKIENFEEAVNLYSSAILLYGLTEAELVALYSNRSAAYLAWAKTSKYHVDSEYLHFALQDGKEVIKLNRNSPKGYYNAGNAYISLNKLTEARKCFDNGLNISPGDEDMLKARDYCRMKLGQNERMDHLDPTTMAPNVQFMARLGNISRSISATDVTNLEKIWPGSKYVGQAHKIMNGENPTIDYKLAAALFTKAGTMGNAEGLYNLAILHSKGLGVSRDFKLSFKLMKQAASKPVFIQNTDVPNIGVAEAEHSIGLSYQEGVGVEQDFKQAVLWYEKAAEHGCSGGSNNLAMLYSTGRGVPLDQQRAVQYWKLSASQGNLNAMQSLAQHYLQHERDPIMAKEWHSRALKHGNMIAKMDSDVFEMNVKQLEDENRRSQVLLAEVVGEVEEAASDSIILTNRFENNLPKLDADSAEIDPTHQKILEENFIKGNSAQASKLYKFDPKILQNYSKNGSTTAARMLLALNHFARALFLLSQPNYKSCAAEIVEEMSECFRIEHVVARFSLESKTKLCDLVTWIIKSTKEQVCVLNKNARICYAHLLMNSFESLLTFAKQSQQLYPLEIAFYQFQFDICGFLRLHSEASKGIGKALKLFPNDIGILYSRAVHLRQLDNPATNDVIAAYEKFLSIAPNDHRKVPESYYAIANEYFAKFQKQGHGPWLSKVQEYYQLGLQAEEIQLPDFLPYECGQKPLTENYIKQLNVQKSKNIQISEKAEEMISEPDHVLLSDPNRVKTITAHRLALLDRRKMLGGFIVTNSKTIKPLNQQRSPKELTGLKTISFSMMDTMEDKVYEGCIIHLTSIEDPGIGVYPSILLALEDEKREIRRAFIYNFPDKDKETIQEKLGFGAKLSIVNPYMRLANDGIFGIRVDDVASMFFHTASGSSKRCRLCGFESANMSNCAKCHWANYCSRKCQEMDWKLLKHKLICNLKTLN